MISKQLKRLGDYRKGGNKGFDTVMTRLQEQCYAVISDFVYLTDKQGKQYGWGVAQYSTPEKFLGDDFSQNVYKRDPKESYERVLEHLQEMLPHAKPEQIKHLLK